MAWTSRRENQACCEGPNGAVNDNENVARLLHSGILEPDYDPFLRKDFFPPADRTASNVCGDADGVSLSRIDGMALDDVRERAVVLAGEHRSGEGALVARAQDLRNIRLALNPLQVVFLYDDPLDDDASHAVLRGLESLDRPEQEELRLFVRLNFTQRIEP